MTDGFERSPWGPWTEYGRNFIGGEEAVAVAIEQILTDGGFLLWQKYLERKAFAFAANSVSDVLVSQMKMCYVPYDEGEKSLDDGWTVEDEPEPSEIDSWARMYLPVRRATKDNDATADRLSAAAKSRVAEAKRKAPQKSAGKNQSSTSGGSKAPKTIDKSESRSVPIPDQIEVDEHEERLRDAKALEEARRKDKEIKFRMSERQKEEERKKVQQLHEEMAKRAHTFDNEGNLIWVEDVKVEKLPKVQEAFGFNVKRDARPRKEETDPKVQSPAPGEKAARKKHTSTSKEAVNIEFTDGFSKLQHGQPPILETMAVQPGVTLESMGKRKLGPDPNAEGHMSRKEYVQLAEREEALGSSQFRPQHSTTTTTATESKSQMDSAHQQRAGGADGPERRQSKEASGGSGGTAPGAEGNLGVTLPPLQPGSGAAQNAQGGTGYPQNESGTGQSSGVKTGILAQAQKEPSAPHPSTRSKKYDAIGHLTRPPRYHPPKLGGQYGLSSAQPPLGATMGHGLVRAGSFKEAYFFPNPTPDLPMGLMRRSASEASPGSGRRSQFRPGDGEGDSWDTGGLMKPETSPAYRNFRHALFPTGDSGSGYFRS